MMISLYSYSRCTLPNEGYLKTMVHNIMNALISLKINMTGEKFFLMVIVLWRESWIKPLSIYDIETDACKYCKRKLHNRDFVTSCEFCDFGIMHDTCANNHIISKHKVEVKRKIELHRDKRLHDYQ
jgi:hypothetical protein